ncbi:MAG: ROK family glucokinase [Butyrivibrio sp.]
MGKLCFGVDLGGTTVKMGLFTDGGLLLQDWEIPTRKEEKGAYILDDIAASINEKIEKEALDTDDIIGVGIGVPGPVTPSGIVKGCVNIGWGDTPVEESLKDKTGFNVKAGNDANVAALGELWQGGGKGNQSLVMVTLGTGVGGGIVLDGKIVKGTHGAAGEIGHMSVVYDETETCNCGKVGCLEQVASATGIVKEAKRFLSKDNAPSSLRDFKDFTAKDVFDEAKKGDVVALKTVDRLGEYLGIALGHISCIIDPDVFIIGGGVSRAGDFLIDAIQKHYVEKAYPQCKKTPIRLATLGNSAGIYGAARLVIPE